MSCLNWQTQIALYAGGDLQPSEVPPVERHLRDCPDCAQLFIDLQADRESITAIPAIEPDYASMRRGVRAAIVRKRIIRRSVSAALLAAAALIPLFVRSPKPHIHPAAVISSSPAPSVVAAVQSVTAPAPHARHPHPAAIQASADQPHVAVYIATRNPKVTILLVSATRKKSNE